MVVIWQGFSSICLAEAGRSETLYIVIDGLKSVSKTPIEEADYRRRLKEQDHEGAREHYLAFIARAGVNEIGRNVKMADLRDNLDISRLKEITESDRQRLNRYKEALAVLKDA